jgi:S1-C subfamily serine protease
VLTNRHVVVGCATLRVGGKQARVVSEDANNDLALLRLDNTVSSVASFREGRGARIGDKVAVAGYPLRGLLSDGLSMTFGNISALAGIGNDSRLYQISAPVNPGNSGGPLLDSAGNIVGIVTSKLNALRTAKLTGDIPQGVNFAIKSSVIRLFLDLNNVDYETARSSSPKSSTQISAEAQKYTMLVQCWK